MKKKSPHWQNDPRWKQNRSSFNRVAEMYEAYRPGYPAAMVEFIVDASRLPPDGRILEIGCGTGIATRLFAALGYSMVCVEPGPNLAAVARRRLAEYPQVSIEISAFEEWADNGRRFDLILSAQAFHWIASDVGYAKSARMLEPSGCLALVWNMYPDPQGPIWDAMDRIYAEHSPPSPQKRLHYLELAAMRAEEISSSGYFEPPQIGVFPWSETYNVEHYLGLLGTYSDHITLPHKQRQSLFAAISDLIHSHGGRIEKPYIAYAYVSRLKP
jgi:SAM-dependent methyltransferase